MGFYADAHPDNHVHPGACADVRAGYYSDVRTHIIAGAYADVKA